MDRDLSHKVLCDLSQDHVKIALVADARSSRGLVRIQPDGAPGKLDADALFERLSSLGLSLRSDAYAVLHHVADEFNARPSLRADVLVAEGKAPIVIDGKVEWLVSLSGGAHAEHGGFMDLRDFGEKSHLVHENETFLRIIPPAEGQSGTDIFGKELTGVGASVTLRPGKNVKRVDETFTATRQGKAIIEAGVVRVEPLFDISEDVDFSTGNIEFSGVVQIGRDVLDQFKVRGDQGVKIGGMVGSAQIESPNGNVEIAQGVVGRGLAVIRAGGHVKMKHVNHAEVHAGKDVLIATEAVNSTITAKGRVVVQGKAIGGELSANDIEVRIAGNEMGTRTVLTIGLHGSVLIHDTAHARVIVRCGSHIHEFLDSTGGPLRVSYDEASHRMTVVKA